MSRRPNVRTILLSVLLPAAGLLFFLEEPHEKFPSRQILARNVVQRSAGVQEGDLVQIHGGPDDRELVEELAVEVRKRGAHPLVTYTSSTLARRLYEAPAKFDAQPPKGELALAKIVDVLITMESQEEDALAGV